MNSQSNNNIAAKTTNNNHSFDCFDIYLLTYEYPELDLLAETRAATVKAKVQAFFDGTPYADPTPFPWYEYAECCRAALQLRRENNLAKYAAQPKTSFKRADTTTIKNNNDIVSLIGQYTQLRKSGHNRFTGKCPLHDDKGPSLTVYADTQSWYCFGACNTGGDILDFIMAINTCDFKQALAILEGQ
jgi:hypothetical protein